MELTQEEITMIEHKRELDRRKAVRQQAAHLRKQADELDAGVTKLEIAERTCCATCYMPWSQSPRINVGHVDCKTCWNRYA